MDILLDFMIKFHKNKLTRLIESKAPYDIIVKESQKLDKLIIKAMREINKEVA